MISLSLSVCFVIDNQYLFIRLHMAHFRLECQFFSPYLYAFCAFTNNRSTRLTASDEAADAQFFKHKQIITLEIIGWLHCEECAKESLHGLYYLRRERHESSDTTRTAAISQQCRFLLISISNLFEASDHISCLPFPFIWLSLSDGSLVVEIGSVHLFAELVGHAQGLSSAIIMVFYGVAWQVYLLRLWSWILMHVDAGMSPV